MKILVLISYYLPGFKAGGQIRSLSNLVDQLGSEHQFYVVTRDRDLGEREAYPGVKRGVWHRIGQAQVLHLSPQQSLAQVWRKIVHEVEPDLFYFNSPFDVRFGIVPLMLARVGLLPRIPTVISAHGIFAPNAMALKSWKKQGFLALERVMGLLNGVSWHATCPAEARDIETVLGAHVSITVAENLCGAADETNQTRLPKQPGCLRLVLLGRVARIKNLDGAIKIVRGLNHPATLDIYGPLEDLVYWQECQQLLSNLPPGIEVYYRGALPSSAVSSTLAQYDALLLPTRNENYGYAIVEAFAAGCPVVISDRTPWRNLEALGVGRDVSLEDHEEFRRVLLQLAEMDEIAHARMRTKARSYWQSIAANKTVAEAYCQLFHKAAGHLPAQPQRRAA
ncbi:MAG: glycosyltransferase family 4 protein [Bythopirellula sp.]|nr:glycosyltransferase family 4 protein [Bythopirellula sp.]